MSTEYILSLSYGKDSLACLEAIKILGYPLHRIITAEVWATDTIPADLPPMVEFKEKADRIIKERYGITVEHISATRERESRLVLKQCSTRSSKKEKKPGESTVFQCKEEHGVIQDLKCKLSTHSKITYEEMFYHIPKRKNLKKEGLIYGFPISRIRGNWCTRLKTLAFLIAPLHKEQTEILCSISVSPLMNTSVSRDTRSPVLCFRW